MDEVYVRTKSAVPTLSRAGYVTEGKILARKLFDYYMLSLYSQSTTYYGNITSLAYSLYKGGDDVEAFSEYVKSSLSTYYGRYFERVIIEVTKAEGELGTLATVELGLVLSDGIKEFTLDSAIDVQDGVILLSNYGLTNGD